jgi:hypothetical protein
MGVYQNVEKIKNKNPKAPSSTPCFNFTIKVFIFDHLMNFNINVFHKNETLTYYYNQS